MFTAKIINKEQVGGAIRVTVEFSDGVTTTQESCIPQDFDGLKFWVRSRLATFNGGKEIDETFSVNDIIDPNDATIVTPAPTRAEIDRDEWLTDYKKWVKVKTTLIDTGILNGTEAQATALKTKVQSNFKPAYLEYIVY